MQVSFSDYDLRSKTSLGSTVTSGNLTSYEILNSRLKTPLVSHRSRSLPPVVSGSYTIDNFSDIVNIQTEPVQSVETYESVRRTNQWEKSKEYNTNLCEMIETHKHNDDSDEYNDPYDTDKYYPDPID